MSFMLAAQVLLSLALLVSGASKLPAHRQTVDAMASLRLPVRKLHSQAARILPWVEIGLALLVWIPVIPLQITLTILTALLMITFLVIIGRALSFGVPVECSCFGSLASPTVSKATLARNILLVTLSLVSILAATRGVLAGAVLDSPLALLSTTIAMVVAIALTVLVLGGSQPTTSEDAAVAPSPASAAPGEEPGEDGMLDYLRQPIPYAMLENPDGSHISLRQLASHKPVLLLLLTPGCGPCERVMDEVSGWTQEMGQLLQIRSVLSHKPANPESAGLDRLEGTIAMDPENNIASVFSTRGNPSAVLLGADGLLAGGPVTGGSEVVDFVEEIRAQLAEMLTPAAGAEDPQS